MFEHADGQQAAIAPRAGRAVIIPRGVWHRAEGPVGWKILYIPFGAGTTHKPVAAS